jgi:serine/threonine-protein kinase
MYKRHWIWMLPLWLVAAGAHAQVTAGDKATAEALFDRGISLMREGKLEEACARLEQSQAIERGIGTMLYLAECYEKSGRTASAWALFREAASEAQAAGQVERAVAGRQRAERLEPSLTKLTVEVPESSRVPGLEIVRNGTPIPRGAWGLPLPVDPGEQRIQVQAPGYEPHTLVIAVERGTSSARVDVPPLVRAPLPAVSDAAAAQSAPGQPTPLPSVAVTTEPPTKSKLKLVGIIVGGVGVALLAVGGGFGIRAINKNNDANEAGCKGKTCTDDDGVHLTNQALTASKVANVGIIGGGALLVGGLLTYFLAPKTERQTKVALSSDGGSLGLHVGGKF